MKPAKSQNARIDQGFPTICRLPMVRMYIQVPTAERSKRTVCAARRSRATFGTREQRGGAREYQEKPALVVFAHAH